MKLRHLHIALLLLLTLNTMAQKQKSSSLRKGQVSADVAAQQERINRMIAATQRIMFIDSMVVDKKDFLQAYHLNPEEGMVCSYRDFFHTNSQPNAYINLNAIGNLCILSQEATDGTIDLYSSDKENGKWTRPKKLQGINDNLQFYHVNYPFLMADGTTLYFAAEGDESLGGYDIFVTTYDTEEDRFLTPENIGMPFNSEANDYMYVVDEYDRIGWFATDRNQPEGMVCIYTFVPSDTHQTYDAEQYTTEEITRFARIADITNTWVTPDIDDALTRLNTAKMRKAKQEAEKAFTFVINDDIDYHQLSDFKAQGNLQRYLQLVKLRNQQTALMRALNRARDYYATASDEERKDMAAEIIATEQQQHQQHLNIKQLEKTIRNEENIYLQTNH